MARVIGKRLDKSGQWVDVYGDDEDERLRNTAVKVKWKNQMIYRLTKRRKKSSKRRARFTDWRVRDSTRFSLTLR